MSLLSRNRLSISLWPDKVALLRSRRKFTLHGIMSDVASYRAISFEPEGEMAWSDALDVLETALPRFVRSNMQAKIILSNHFVHYVLVPWCDNLSDEDELAYARHCFKEVYGDASDGWEIRVSPNVSGAPAVASAIDVRLLDEVRGLMARMRLNIKSIQPHLMVAFNSCSTRLTGMSAWFALLEQDSLCLALLQNGQFTWLRKMRIGDEWHNELPILLEREMYLANVGEEVDEVLLWAPQLEEKDIPTVGRWKIQQLKPGLGTDYKLGRDDLDSRDE